MHIFKFKFTYIFFIAYIISLTISTNAYSKNLQQKSLEDCLIEYGEKFRSNLNPLNAKQYCQNEVEKFIVNPGFLIKPGSTSDENWNQAINVLGIIIKPNGKKSSFGYMMHGPLVGKWWAIKQ